MLTPDRVLLADERDIFNYVRNALSDAKDQLPRIIAERIVSARWEELSKEISTANIGPLVNAAVVQVLVEKLKGL